MSDTWIKYQNDAVLNTGLLSTNNFNMTAVVELDQFIADKVRIYVTPTKMDNNSASSIHYGDSHPC